MAKVMYGYGGTMLTWDQLGSKSTWTGLHPEMRRRFQALTEYLASQGVVFGIGTGWRVQPENKPGFASPGNSWHEGVPVSSRANALAIDTVPSSSWPAMERELARFGLRSFKNVNNEPWHIQLIEIPASRRYATSLPPIKVWDLPGIGTGGGTVTPPQPPSWKPTDDRVATPTLRRGDSGGEVVQLQQTCNFWGWGDVGNADGQFGARTEDAVKIMQQTIGAQPDGEYGPASAKALQSFFKAMDDIAGGGEAGGGGESSGGGDDHAPGSRTLKVASPQLSGDDVTYVQKVLAGNGLSSIDVDGHYGNNTAGGVKSLQGWNGLTKDGICGPDTWTAILAYPKPA